MTRQPVARWLASAASCGGVWLALALPAHAMDDTTASQLAALQQQVDTLNQRLSTVQSQQASPILTLQSQIDDLKTALEQLRGQMDEQTHELAVAEKRQTDLYQDLDSRLRALTQNGVPTASGSSGAGAAGAAVDAAGADSTGFASGANDAHNAANPASNTGGDVVAQAYQTALSQFKQGDYKGAIGSFQKFIKKNPRDDRASSAQYWIGNAYFSLKDFKNAAQAQQRLIALYPRATKVPDAMLNLSSAQVEMGNLDAAQATLKKLIKKFSGTPAAQLGKKRLQLLESN